jgi:hypothetical protein
VARPPQNRAGGFHRTRLKQPTSAPSVGTAFRSVECLVAIQMKQNEVVRVVTTPVLATDHMVLMDLFAVVEIVPAHRADPVLGFGDPPLEWR